MNSIRDHFPNLNEFCLSDSREIIAWMKDHKLGKTYKSIFERDDIITLIESCPNIEFMIDGIIHLYWDSHHIDEALISKLEKVAMNIMLYNVRWSRVAIQHHETINTFMHHSYSPARARILIWCVSQLMFECGYEVTLKDVRASIVRTVANYANI